MSGDQWWLATVNKHGVPRLVDGPHDTREGADRAAYLHGVLGLAHGDLTYAVAHVELSVPQPSSKGVDHEAVAELNRLRRG
jgi:hypothetical protein